MWDENLAEDRWWAFILSLSRRREAEAIWPFDEGGEG